MKDAKYLVSFGNSPQYITSDPELIHIVTDNLHREMAKLFPLLGKEQLPEPAVMKIEEPEKYRDYSELSPEAVPLLLQILTNSRQEKNDVRELNSDAPYDALDPDAVRH